LDEKEPEIQGEGDSDFDREVRGETLPAVQEEPPKTEELDPTTATALKLRYCIFKRETAYGMVQDENKEVWFVADDVCKVLGYKNTKDAISKHCSKVIDSKDLVEGETELCKKITVDTKGGKQAMIAINEPDLYRLIMRSRMPDARKFEKWVVEDVLPTIRKTGKYTVKRKIDYAPATDATTVAPAEESAQCELFPNMMPSMTFPKPLTEKINAAKLKLYNEGHTFPNNKEFVKFLITRALKDLEG
jgi:prophage antirepressor-like protein